MHRPPPLFCLLLALPRLLLRLLHKRLHLSSLDLLLQGCNVYACVNWSPSVRNGGISHIGRVRDGFAWTVVPCCVMVTTAPSKIACTSSSSELTPEFSLMSVSCICSSRGLMRGFAGLMGAGATGKGGDWLRIVALLMRSSCVSCQPDAASERQQMQLLKLANNKASMMQSICMAMSILATSPHLHENQELQILFLTRFLTLFMLET